MPKKKIDKAKEKPTEVNEPTAAYGEKRIAFFNSFEESKEQSRIEMAEASYEQRLMNIKLLRQRSKQFTPVTETKNNSKTITIITAHYL